MVSFQKQAFSYLYQMSFKVHLWISIESLESNLPYGSSSQICQANTDWNDESCGPMNTYLKRKSIHHNGICHCYVASCYLQHPYEWMVFKMTYRSEFNSTPPNINNIIFLIINYQHKWMYFNLNIPGCINCLLTDYTWIFLLTSLEFSFKRKKNFRRKSLSSPYITAKSLTVGIMTSFESF